MHEFHYETVSNPLCSFPKLVSRFSMTHACGPKSVSSGLEFHPGNGDDSWYYVSLRLQYGKLKVHYEGLADKLDGCIVKCLQNE